MTTTTYRRTVTTQAEPEHLPDDFAAAIKAADDYADTLDTLARHDLPEPMASWVRLRADDITETHIPVLRDAARTFGGQS